MSSALTEKACKVFKKSGDHFFNEFKKMHDQLCMQTVSMLKERYSDTDHIRADEILLVLRLWAGEIKKPKGNKRKRSSLYQDAMDISMKSSIAMSACKAVCLGLAWNWVMDECEKRASLAAKSTHWDEEANMERYNMWEGRIEAMSYTDDIDRLSNIVLDEPENNLALFLADFVQYGVQDLECAVY